MVLHKESVRHPEFPDGHLFLVCSTRQLHIYSCRRCLSLVNAKTLVQLHDLKCRKGHPMTARSNARGSLFIGCENYPQCEETASFSLLSGG